MEGLGQPGNWNVSTPRHVNQGVSARKMRTEAIYERADAREWWISALGPWCSAMEEYSYIALAV